MCLFIYLWARSFRVTPQDRRTPSDIFTDFHRRRSCLTACEFGTFTLVGGGGGGGGGGGIYPNLLSPTRDFLLLFISLFPIMDRGSRPWTLSQFRAHHTHSPRMVNSTSQFSRIRLDAMLHAYECNMPIHIFNSHGSYAIIFHIIQTIMLTHQFSMHQQSHSPHIKHAIHIKK